MQSCKFILLTLAVAIALSTANAKPKAAPLKFSFYITSQCRDTMRFVTTQLYPDYQELGEYLDIEFVPWGKSRRNNDSSVTCQFGPTDCEANKIQSCVLNLLGDDQSKMVDYINCEMTTLASVEQDYSCATSVQVSEAAAKACYESQQAKDLEAENERKTGTITMVFVPTIVYNDVYSAANQNAAYADFKNFVCGLLTEEKPAACN